MGKPESAIPVGLMKIDGSAFATKISFGPAGDDRRLRFWVPWPLAILGGAVLPALRLGDHPSAGFSRCGASGAKARSSSLL
jgi:hypothetical protein